MSEWTHHLDELFNLFRELVEKELAQMREEFPKCWDAMDARITCWEDTNGRWHEGRYSEAVMKWARKWNFV
jgi:hypothetical protein